MSDSTWYYNEETCELGCWVQVGSENKHYGTRKYFCILDNNSTNYGMNRVNDKLQTNVPSGYEPIADIRFVIKMFNEKRFPPTKILISQE